MIYQVNMVPFHIAVLVAHYNFEKQNTNPLYDGGNNVHFQVIRAEAAKRPQEIFLSWHATLQRQPCYTY